MRTVHLYAARSAVATSPRVTAFVTITLGIELRALIRREHCADFRHLLLPHRARCFHLLACLCHGGPRGCSVSLLPRVACRFHQRANFISRCFVRGTILRANCLDLFFLCVREIEIERSAGETRAVRTRPARTLRSVATELGMAECMPATRLHPMQRIQFGALSGCKD